jgi:hypothetical protein
VGEQVRRVQGGTRKQQEARGGGRGRRAGNRRRGRRKSHSGEERLSSRGRKGVERRTWMRELVKEGVISRVGQEGKEAVKDTFTNCLKDSSGDLLDQLPKQFRT